MTRTPASPTALACSVLLITLASSPTPAANNAQYIRSVIPDTVITDQTFDAQILMKNTGTAAWSQTATAVTLVSQTPAFNMTWGTYFIILGQGNSVAPGDTFAFTSPLKAPHTPGDYNFGWQCQNWLGTWDTTTAFFGQVVTGVSIHVKQRTATPPPPPPHRDSLLDTSDFEYMGSFRLPNLNGFEDLYTESGLALRTTANGTKRLQDNTGTYAFTLYEMDIPPLVNIVGGNEAGLNTATTRRTWGDLNIGTVNGEAIASNAGFWFDDSASLLYWSHNNGYFTGGAADFPTLMATRLDTATGSVTQVHAWRLPTFPARYKGYWGGITKLSKSFADANTGGRDLALGYGGYYSICGPASRGPALGAIARPSASRDTVDLREMLTYPDPIACPREGNYLPQVGFWNDYAASPWQGSWTYDDYCRAGVFIDLPDKKGYVTFVQQVTGRVGYDYGGYNTDGHSQNCWYFYDVNDLGAVARGAKSASSVLPSSYAVVQYPLDGGLVPGACFDPQTRMLYLYVQWSLSSGEPVIHAYHVKIGQAGVRTVRTAASKVTALQARVNPVAREVHIALTGRQGATVGGKATLTVVDARGVCVFRMACAASRLADGVRWDAATIPAGVYLIRTQVGAAAMTCKVTMP